MQKFKIIEKIKVSFDFDATLSLDSVQAYAEKIAAVNIQQYQKASEIRDKEKIVSAKLEIAKNEWIIKTTENKKS